MLVHPLDIDGVLANVGGIIAAKQGALLVRVVPQTSLEGALGAINGHNKLSITAAIGLDGEVSLLSDDPIFKPRTKCSHLGIFLGVLAGGWGQRSGGMTGVRDRVRKVKWEVDTAQA